MPSDLSFLKTITDKKLIVYNSGCKKTVRTMYKLIGHQGRFDKFKKEYISPF